MNRETIIYIFLLLLVVNKSNAQFINKKSVLSFDMDFKSHHNAKSFYSWPLSLPGIAYGLSYEYSIKKKLSLGVSYSKYEKEFDNHQSGGYREYHFISGGVMPIKAIGLNVNLFLVDNIAPVGTSVSFFLKRYDSEMSNFVDQIYTYDSGRKYIQEMKSGVLKYRGFNVGARLNGMFFLSNKIPLFTKLSFGIGYRIFGKFRLNGEVYEFNDEDKEIMKYNMSSLFSFYRYTDLITGKISLGYWF